MTHIFIYGTNDVPLNAADYRHIQYVCWKIYYNYRFFWLRILVVILIQTVSDIVAAFIYRRVAEADRIISNLDSL